MGKRDYITEILSKKQRTLLSSRRWDLVSERLRDINSICNIANFIEHLPQLEGVEDLQGFEWVAEDIETMKYNYGLKTEILRYIPIGLVACIEGYFRQLYADLIDHGSPYKENASKFSDIKFSIEIAISLEFNSVSIGDFVAHLLTTNNLDNLNRNVSTLIGSDFLEQLKAVRSKAIRQKYLIPIDDDELTGHMIQGIKRMFELRHIFCHEVDPVISDKDIKAVIGYPSVTIDFLWMTEFFIGNLLSEKSNL